MPGKSHGQRSLVDLSPWDRKESGTTEQLHFLSLSFYSNHIASFLHFGLAKLIPTSDALHTPPSICGLLNLISLSFRSGISYNLKHCIQNFSHHIHDLPCFYFFFNVCLHCLFFYAKMSAAGNKSYIILGLIASSFLSFRFIHKHQIRVRAKPMFNVIYLILGEDELKNITPKLQSWRYLSYLLNSQLILSEHLL